MKIDLGMLGAHRLQIFGQKTRRDFIASASIRQPQVVSTFMEDFRFRDFMKSRVPEYRREFDWNDKRRDPNRKYVVDCHVNSMKRPLLVFAVSSDDKGKDATISLLNFEKWKLRFQSLAIFQDLESISPKPLARFADVTGKSFSSLTEETKPRIAEFLKETMYSR